MGRPIGRKAISESKYHDLATKLGIDYIGPYPPTASDKTWWKCPNNHIFDTTYRNLFLGHGCRKCAYNRVHTKYSWQDYESAGSKYGHTFLGPLPRNTHAKTNWCCKWGHKWETSLQSLRRCKQCLSKQPDEYYSLAKEMGLEWLGPIVNSIDNKTNWKCPYGHINSITYYYVSKGHTCRVCSGKKPIELSGYLVRAKERGIEFVGPMPVNSTSKTIWRCPAGHMFESTYNRLRSICGVNRGTGCAKCRNQNRTGENNPLWKGGKAIYLEDATTRLKRVIRRRDDYRCQICGKNKTEYGRRMDVHHIIPVRYAPDHLRDTEKNMITMCRKHHKQAEFHLDVSISQLRNLLSEKYGYSYSDDPLAYLPTPT